MVLPRWMFLSKALKLSHESLDKALVYSWASVRPVEIPVVGTVRIHELGETNRNRERVWTGWIGCLMLPLPARCYNTNMVQHGCLVDWWFAYCWLLVAFMPCFLQFFPMKEL